MDWHLETLVVDDSNPFFVRFYVETLIFYMIYNAHILKHL